MWQLHSLRYVCYSLVNFIIQQINKVLKKRLCIFSFTHKKWNYVSRILNMELRSSIFDVFPLYLGNILKLAFPSQKANVLPHYSLTHKSNTTFHFLGCNFDGLSTYQHHQNLYFPSCLQDTSLYGIWNWIKIFMNERTLIIALHNNKISKITLSSKCFNALTNHEL